MKHGEAYEDLKRTSAYRSLVIAVGLNVRRYRRLQHLTQRELAMLAYGDANRASDISKIECGIKPCTIESSVKIAIALGLSVDALYNLDILKFYDKI